MNWHVKNREREHIALYLGFIQNAFGRVALDFAIVGGRYGGRQLRGGGEVVPTALRRQYRYSGEGVGLRVR